MREVDDKVCPITRKTVRVVDLADVQRKLFS